MIVSLHEETLNKLLAAVGEIKGTNDYEVSFVKGKYHWYLQNSQIQLLKDSAKFFTDAKVSVGPFKYTDKVEGRVSVTYSEKTNQIAVKVVDAVFEVYTTILGAKISIKKVQIADYLKTPFLFEGPMTMQSSMEFMMPDSTKKTIYAKPSKCDLKILPHQIVVSSEVDFTDKPFLLQKK